MATICPYDDRKCNDCPHYRTDMDGDYETPVCWVEHDELAASKRPDAILKYMAPDDGLTTAELNAMVAELDTDDIELVNADTEHGVLMGVMRHDVCNCKLDFNTASNGLYIKRVAKFVDTVSNTSEPITTRIMDIRTKIVFPIY